MQFFEVLTSSNTTMTETADRQHQGKNSKDDDDNSHD